MSGSRAITRGQARTAFAVALLADLLQLPLTLGSLSGVFSLPAESIDLLTDVVVAALLVRLLGFHWALAPAVILELIPIIDFTPTWTACVAYVIAERKRQGRYFAS